MVQKVSAFCTPIITLFFSFLIVKVGGFNLLKEIRNYFDIKHVDGDITCIPKMKNVYSNESAIQAIETLRKHKANALYLLREEQLPSITDVYAVDLETTSLDPRNGDIRLVACWSSDQQFVTTDVAEVAAILRDETILKVFHNGAFDVPWLEDKGFPVVNYTDTMIMSQIISNRARSGNSLQALSLKYLNVVLNKTLQESTNWQGELTEQHKAYALKDAEVTYKLYHHLRKKISEKHLDVVVNREMGAMSAIIELNKNGILFDYEGWSVVLTELEKESIGLESEIRQLLECEDLNLNSPKQLIEVFASHGLMLESSADEILARHETDHVAVEPLRKYKKLKKQLSTYGEKLKQQIDKDGRIRGQWRLIGTDTSRMTCKQPNLQGLPTIAKPYVKASPGYKLVVADYNTIELRILAELTRDKELMKAFLNNEDLHAKTTRAVLNMNNDEAVTDEERSIGKVVNFGLVYGMTAYGLRKKIQSTTRWAITHQEAENFRNRYFELYPAVLTFQDQMLRAESIHTFGGRYWSKATTELKQGAISRYNYPVQGTAAEGFKEALALLMSRKPADWKLIAAIHDEIVLEVPEEAAKEATELLIKAMKQGMTTLIPSIPIEVDCKVSHYWTK